MRKPAQCYCGHCWQWAFSTDLLLWRWTDDLQLYTWAQFFPFLALVLILRLFPPKYTGASYWVAAAALYALAKLLEFYDEKIYSVGSIVSGHTLKHLAAAAAEFVILRLSKLVDHSMASCKATSLPCRPHPPSRADRDRVQKVIFAKRVKGLLQTIPKIFLTGPRSGHAACRSWIEARRKLSRYRHDRDCRPDHLACRRYRAGLRARFILIDVERFARRAAETDPYSGERDLKTENDAFRQIRHRN